MSLWVAFIVVVNLQNEVHVYTNETPFKTRAECVALQAKVKQLFDDGKVEPVKNYVLKCVDLSTT